MVKFKDFSRHLSVCQVLFKANLITKDFSRHSCIFKYISSMYEPSVVRHVTDCTMQPGPCSGELSMNLGDMICGIGNSWAYLMFNNKSTVCLLMTSLIYISQRKATIKRKPRSNEFNENMIRVKLHISHFKEKTYLHDLWPFIHILASLCSWADWILKDLAPR